MKTTIPIIIFLFSPMCFFGQTAVVIKPHIAAYGTKCNFESTFSIATADFQIFIDSRESYNQDAVIFHRYEIYLKTSTGKCAHVYSEKNSKFENRAITEYSSVTNIQGNAFLLQIGFVPDIGRGPLPVIYCHYLLVLEPGRILLFDLAQTRVEDDARYTGPAIRLIHRTRTSFTLLLHNQVTDGAANAEPKMESRPQSNAQLVTFSPKRVTLQKLEYALINDDQVRLRKGPGLQNPVIDLLEKNELVFISERSRLKTKVGVDEDYWYLVIRATDAGQGWVFGVFLKLGL
jgi:hypothetical protein